jgi:hypothetical protein
MIPEDIRLEVDLRLREELKNSDLRESLNKLPEAIGMVALQVQKLNILIEEIYDDLNERLENLERKIDTHNGPS